MNNYSDKFGYYSIGDYCTYSKLEAIELHQKINIHPKWHFNDFVFGNFDWSIEPKESLKELYAIRAKQIREKYDYLVLWYSSGSDSQNILETFIDNQIRLDEIASCWALEGDNRYDTHFNGEIYERAIPTALKIVDNDKTIKHRVIDLTRMILEIYSDKNFKHDFLYHSNSMFSPNNATKSFFREKIDDYKRIIDSGKSLCFIHGADKPRIFLENGRYCLKFIDLIDTCVNNRTMQLARPWEHDEFFYWSADLPQLIAKQAHIVKNYLRGNSINLSDFELGERGKSFGVLEKNGNLLYLTSEAMQRLIYGFSIASMKPSNFAFSTRDAWFWSKPEYFDQAQIYINGIKKLESVLPKH